jgi:hypothetical protein
MEGKDTSGGLFQKKQFSKANKNSPKTCSFKRVALMGRNVTANSYLAFPASAEFSNINNINWLVRYAGESGM